MRGKFIKLSSYEYSAHKILLAFLSSLCFFPLAADVFTLGPGGEKLSSPSFALSPTALWTEPIIINGQKFNLKISLLQKDLASSFFILRKLYPSAKFAFNSSAVLFEVLEDNIKKRLYLIQCGSGAYPVLQFSIEFKDIPLAGRWPHLLPLPSASEPIQTIEFPDRASICGILKSSLSAPQALSSVNSSLLADGWIALSGEAAKGTGISGKGEFYIRYNPTEIICVSFTDAKNGGSEGSIYRKKLRPK